ncbi:hypothetical protein BCR34DRAFT_619731 [Clohesyomyces aquaticus]|uniref:Uncharacterized protein n=1 Tax=Clohesyomyces aquaticus TaxID=1231657 RepID=A0A1Y1YE62_9PLEO|nr:hypothetical protein BCR34DRAFT_619731 [Clohesyomyces aquaticus]
MASSDKSRPQLWLFKTTQTIVGYQLVNEKSLKFNAKKPEHRLLEILHLLLLLATLLAPPNVLALWWYYSFRPNNLQLWRSTPIGGKFEQIVAKGIDFVSGAILAPLAMALVNLLWFHWARVLACNEVSNRPRGTQLVSLLELSAISGGTYSPWNLWSLVRSSRIRLVLVALLALLSAVSMSLFVNIVAYEVVDSYEPFSAGTNWSLVELPRLQLGYEWEKWSAISFLDPDIIVNITSTLHQMSCKCLRIGSGQAWLSDSGEYIAVNASKASLNSVQRNVRELWQVPASRMGIECLPADIQSLRMVHDYRATIQYPDQENTSVVVNYPLGSGDQILQLNLNGLQYVNFWDPYDASTAKRVALLVLCISYQGVEYKFHNMTAIPSDFGNLPRRVDLWRDVTGDEDHTKDYYTTTWYGIGCDLHRSRGVVDLTRGDSQSQNWAVSSYSFPDKVTPMTSPLWYLDSIRFRYQSPLASLSGFGNALGAFAHVRNGTKFMTNMTAYAHAFVYASGAIETIMINSAVSNVSTVPNPRKYDVSGMQTTLKYQMTYIPGILVSGLITLTPRAAIVFGPVIASRGSLSMKSMREVDGLRFAVDFAEAVREDEMLVDASTWKRETLEEWADGVRLRYVIDGKGDDGDTNGEGGRIRLVKE